MIEFKKGDIFAEDAEALVNTVNCVGVMGRGVALQFKKAFPENFDAYARACDRKEVRPGRMFVFETGELANPRYIINFPTKRHWRRKSRIEDIDAGLDALVAAIRERNIRSIAVPPLGSGLGGLDWSAVRARIETALRPLAEMRVVVFEPAGAPKADDMARSPGPPKMTRGRAALVGLIRRYLDAGLDPFVTLLESPQTGVFHAGCRGTLAAAVRERTLRSLCRKPAACSERDRGAFHIGLRRRRRRPGQDHRTPAGSVGTRHEFVEKT